MVHAVEGPCVCWWESMAQMEATTASTMPLERTSMVTKGSFDSAGRFASESVCSAQDNNGLGLDERGSISSAGPRRERRELVGIDMALASEHQTEAIKIEIDDRRSEQGEGLAHDQSADNR